MDSDVKTVWPLSLKCFKDKEKYIFQHINLLYVLFIVCTEASIAKRYLVVHNTNCHDKKESCHDKELRNGSWFCGYERNISAAKKPLVQCWQETALTRTTGAELVGTSGLTGAAKKEALGLEKMRRGLWKWGGTPWATRVLRDPVGCLEPLGSSATTVANTILIIINKCIL